MTNILQTIADYAKERVRTDKNLIPLEKVKEEAQALGRFGMPNFVQEGAFPENVSPKDAFESALKKPGISFICEVKKASPSKGIIAENFPYTKIAAQYEEAGADAISCLTEPKWFLGNDEIFREVRSAVSLPMIRKDFLVDEYQIYQARLIGANAVLLIVSILSEEQLGNYLNICSLLGLAALVEAHDELEVELAKKCGAKIIGVNNRNLKDFSVDTGNSMRLREAAGRDVIFVAESGIKTHEEVAALEKMDVDAVLIGETMMRAEDKGKMLKELRG